MKRCEIEKMAFELSELICTRFDVSQKKGNILPQSREDMTNLITTALTEVHDGAIESAAALQFKTRGELYQIDIDAIRELKISN